MTDMTRTSIPHNVIAKSVTQSTTPKSLGGLLKSAFDIMRKDEGLNGGPRPPADAHLDHVPETGFTLWFPRNSSRASQRVRLKGKL
jgi:hypothetical protein